jgi:26S proteasome regulatory subunit N10
MLSKITSVSLFLSELWVMKCSLSLSPVTYDKKALESIGKKLKKNNVALDVVDFGETDDEKPEKLEALIAACNSSDSSHIVHVPPGEHALSDVLIR